MLKLKELMELNLMGIQIQLVGYVLVGMNTHLLIILYYCMANKDLVLVHH